MPHARRPKQRGVCWWGEVALQARFTVVLSVWIYHNALRALATQLKALGGRDGPGKNWAKAETIRPDVIQSAVVLIRSDFDDLMRLRSLRLKPKAAPAPRMGRGPGTVLARARINALSMLSC
jgi:hypothetical protein